MNRLWIYLSLTFTTVIVLAVVAIILSFRLTASINSGPNDPLSPDVTEYLRERSLQQFPRDFTLVAMTIGVIAIGAGIWISRRLTKPLSELEEGAIAIGQQDLSRRVQIHGSKEFVAVATSFNKMASLLEQEEMLRRNLLADVTHELRHPIHILQGNLQAILDDIYPLNKQEIGKLVDQTAQLSILVNDLHILAEAEAHQLPLAKQRLNIADLVKEAADSYSSFAASRNITLRVELLGTIPQSIYLDKARMQQVMNNLLDNAIRHTPNGGFILVTLEKSDSHLMISVADTGKGINEDQLPYVFDRFYRVDKARDRSANSTGLGLAIVKVIVEAHDGFVQVTSKGAEQGSTFTIYLEMMGNID